LKVYTRTGDDGTTGLGSGKRIPKDALRLDAYGSVDELNSVLGVAIAVGLTGPLSSLLLRIQQELFVLGADLSVPEEDKKERSLRLSEELVARLESEIDELSEPLSPLANFILPGGSAGAAHLHVARTVCRRAERLAVSLAREEEVNGVCVHYLNRLSDALFVMARYENHGRGVEDVLWRT
jgi:cob(I)alamin adenosyltransferase